MSTYSSIRDAIVTAVETVTSVGVVHNRVRFSVDWSTFNSQFKATISGSDQIRGWWVTWAGIPETGGDFEGFDGTTDTYRFVVRGVMSLKDGDDSETAFFNLLSDVIDAVRETPDFGVAAVVKETVTVRTSEPDIRQFGSVLCHFCEIYVDCVVVR